MIEGAGDPATSNLPSFRHADKLLHAAAHAVLSLLVFGAVHMLGRSAWLAGAIAFAFSAVVGIGVELVQSGPGAAHGRHFDGFDIAANLVGAAVALTLVLASRHLPPYTGKSGG